MPSCCDTHTTTQSTTGSGSLQIGADRHPTIASSSSNGTSRSSSRSRVVDTPQMITDTDGSYDRFDPTVSQQHMSADEEEEQLLREIEESDSADDKAQEVQHDDTVGKERDGRPTQFDVLLGRGKSNTHHPGNQTFQDLVQVNRERYFSTTSAVVKRSIVAEIVALVQEKGRFLKKEKGVWTKVEEEVANQKVAHAIQYRRRRSLKEEAPNSSDTNGACPRTTELDDDCSGTEYSSESKSHPTVESSVRKAKVSRPLEDESTRNYPQATTTTKRRCRQQAANDAARSWMQHSAAVASVSRAVRGETQCPPQARGETTTTTTHPPPPPPPPFPLDAGETGVMDEFECLPTFDVMPSYSTTDPLDCSGLHSLADLLNCIENQELLTLTNAAMNHHRDAPLSSLASQLSSGRSAVLFPTKNVMAAFSNSSLRSSSVGTFDPRIVEDGDEHVESQQQQLLTQVVFHPDTFEPHPVHSTIDPLDCSGLHSLADLLSSMDGNNSNHYPLKPPQDLAATMAATTSVEHYLTSINTVPESIAATTHLHSGWYDEKSRSLATAASHFNHHSQSCVVPKSVYGTVAL